MTGPKFKGGDLAVSSAFGRMRVHGLFVDGDYVVQLVDDDREHACPSCACEAPLERYSVANFDRRYEPAGRWR